MPVPPISATPLARLHAGDIDLDGYLDLMVSEALVPLGGLSAHDLRALRLDLRDRLQTDPTQG